MPANDPQPGETWKHKHDGAGATVVRLYERSGTTQVVYRVHSLDREFEYSTAHFMFHFDFVSARE